MSSRDVVLLCALLLVAGVCLPYSVHALTTGQDVIALCAAAAGFASLAASTQAAKEQVK